MGALCSDLKGLPQPTYGNLTRGVLAGLATVEGVFSFPLGIHDQELRNVFQMLQTKKDQAARDVAIAPARRPCDDDKN